MSAVRTTLASGALAVLLAGAVPASALAAPDDPVLPIVGSTLAAPVVPGEAPAPAEPPVANCGFLSAFVCQVPVSILVPVNIESVFPPQPTG